MSKEIKTTKITAKNGLKFECNEIKYGAQHYFTVKAQKPKAKKRVDRLLKGEIWAEGMGTLKKTPSDDNADK